MILLIATLMLISVALIMVGMRLLRPRFSYFWLIAATAATLAWVIVLAARWLTPDEWPNMIPLVTWEPDFLFPVSPGLLVDDISWSFSLVLVTLALAALLTDAGRKPLADEDQPNTRGWAACLTLTALALLAVLAENLLTLIIAWAAIDLAEFLIWTSEIQDRPENGRIVVNYATRIAGILAIIAAGMFANASGSPLGFSATNPEIGLFLLLAAGLRLGVLPPNAPIPQRASGSGLDAILRLAPAAASLALLPRVSIPPTSPTLASLLLITAGLAVAYSGISWFSSSSAHSGTPFWVMGIAGLALIAALLGQPGASLGWGMSLLLAGGLLILYHAHHRFLASLALISAACLLMIPYTPTWPAVRVFGALPIIPGGLLLLLQAPLFAGYLRQGLNPEPALNEVERWVWLIYPSGLTLLLVTYLALGWWLLFDSASFASGPPSILESRPVLANGFVVTILLLLWRRGRRLPEGLVNAIRRVFSIEWLYRLIWGTYNFLRRVFSGLSLLLEGQAGILWALLVLALILSLIIQVETGG